MVKQSENQQSKQEVKVLYPQEALQVEVKPDGIWVSWNDFVVITYLVQDHNSQFPSKLNFSAKPVGKKRM